MQTHKIAATSTFELRLSQDRNRVFQEHRNTIEWTEKGAARNFAGATIWKSAPFCDGYGDKTFDITRNDSDRENVGRLPNKAHMSP